MVIVTSWGIGIVYLVSWVEAATASLQEQKATKQYYKWACLKCTHTILSFPTYKINKHQPFPGVFRPFFLYHLHAIRTPWTCKCFVLPPPHGADPTQHINFFCAPRFKGNSPWLSPQTEAAGHRTSNWPQQNNTCWLKQSVVADEIVEHIVWVRFDLLKALPFDQLNELL